MITIKSLKKTEIYKNTKQEYLKWKKKKKYET